MKIFYYFESFQVAAMNLNGENLDSQATTVESSLAEDLEALKIDPEQEAQVISPSQTSKSDESSNSRLREKVRDEMRLMLARSSSSILSNTSSDSLATNITNVDALTSIGSKSSTQHKLRKAKGVVRKFRKLDSTELTASPAPDVKIGQRVAYKEYYGNEFGTIRWIGECSTCYSICNRMSPDLLIKTQVEYRKSRLTGRPEWNSTMP